MEVLAPPHFEIHDLYTEVAAVVPQGYLIVPESGRISPACYTKEYARRMLLEFMTQGDITPREAQVLRRQIKHLPLPERLTENVRAKLVQKSLYAITVIQYDRDIEGPMWTWHESTRKRRYCNS